MSHLISAAFCVRAFHVLSIADIIMTVRQLFTAPQHSLLCRALY